MSSHRYAVRRSAPQLPSHQGPGVGVADVDITPRLATSLTGYGLLRRRYARGLYGRLQATAIVVQDDTDKRRRVAIVACDLHAAPRVLTELVASKVPLSCGVGVDALLLYASHSHSGPGHLYGGAFYDVGAAPGGGFDVQTTEWLAARIASAIVAACADLEAHTNRHLRVGHAILDAPILWHRNFDALAGDFVKLEESRGTDTDGEFAPMLDLSVQAFATGPHNNEPHRLRALAAELAGVPLAEIPLHAPNLPRRYATRMRVDVLSVHEGDASAPPADTLVGAIGFLDATPTMVGRRPRLLTADAVGLAASMVRWRAGKRLPIGMAGGAVGDVNIVPADMAAQGYRSILNDAALDTAWDGDWSARDALRRPIRAAASHIATAITSAVGASHAVSDPSVAAGMVEFGLAGRKDTVPAADIADAVTANMFRTRAASAAPAAEVGVSFLAGSELQRKGKAGDPSSDVINDGGLFGEGTRKWFDGSDVLNYVADVDEPHHPKVAAPPYGGLIGAPQASIPSIASVRAARFGTGPDGVLLVTVPGECTTMFAHQLRFLIGQRTPNAPGTLVIGGPAGEYIGYFPTIREYLRQPYEGGSAWWGRDSGTILQSRICAMAEQVVTAGDGAAPPTGNVAFDTPIETHPIVDAGDAFRDRHIPGAPGAHLDPVTHAPDAWIVRGTAIIHAPGLPDGWWDSANGVGTPWLRLERQTSPGHFAAVSRGGIAIDDVATPAWIEVADVHKHDGAAVVRLAFAWDVPLEALAAGDVIRVVVAIPAAAFVAASDAVTV